MMAPFFNVVVHRENGNRDLNGLCAGFEMKSWRKEQLVNHLMDYIPEFALTYSELVNRRERHKTNVEKCCNRNI